MPASLSQPITIDVVSDVVCPWCYIGKARLDKALGLLSGVPVSVRWRPYFLNPWVPREGMARHDYLTEKFGSVEAYEGIAARVREAAAEEGLDYNAGAIARQPNTLDCHRLIHWAEAAGEAGAMKQKLMDLYFRDGADLTDREVLVRAAADCGLDPDDVRARLASDEDVEEISRQAQTAAAAGIEGVPTFIFAGRYALSGAYPVETLVAAIRRVADLQAQEATPVETPPMPSD